MRDQFRIKASWVCFGIFLMPLFRTAAPKVPRIETSTKHIWIGTITVEETGYAFLDKDDSRENLKKTRYLNHTLTDKATLVVRGSGGSLDILDARRIYKENYEEKNFLEHDHQLCSDGQMMRPGNSNVYEKSISRTIYRGARDENQYKRVDYTVKLIGMSESECLVHVSSVALVDTEIDESTEIRWACQDETQTSKIESRTCAPDEEARSYMSGQGTSHTHLSSTNPPAEKILGGILKGVVDNNTMKGKQVIYEQQPTSLEGMAVKCVAEWNLRRMEQKTPCMAYIQMVQGDVTINGIDVEEGAYPGDLRGARISLGPKSRMKINFGDAIIYLGENTEIDLVDPCAREGRDTAFDARLMRGKIYAVLSRLTGKGSAYHKLLIGMAGVRGLPAASLGTYIAEVPELDPSGPWAPISSSSSSAYEEEQAQVFPFNEEEIAENAARAFMIENMPDKTSSIRAIRGPIEIVDSTGETSILNTGETFTKEWKRAERYSENKDVLVRAQYSPSHKIP